MVNALPFANSIENGENRNAKRFLTYIECIWRARSQIETINPRYTSLSFFCMLFRDLSIRACVVCVCVYALVREKRMFRLERLGFHVVCEAISLPSIFCWLSCLIPFLAQFCQIFFLTFGIEL